MRESTSVHLKTYFMLALMIVFAPLGNVLLGKGMKGVSAAASWQPAASSWAAAVARARHEYSPDSQGGI